MSFLSIAPGVASSGGAGVAEAETVVESIVMGVNSFVSTSGFAVAAADEYQQ